MNRQEKLLTARREAKEMVASGALESDEVADFIRFEMSEPNTYGVPLGTDGEWGN